VDIRQQAQQAYETRRVTEQEQNRVSLASSFMELGLRPEEYYITENSQGEIKGHVYDVPELEFQCTQWGTLVAYPVVDLWEWDKANREYIRCAYRYVFSLADIGYLLSLGRS